MVLCHLEPGEGGSYPTRQPCVDMEGWPSGLRHPPEKRAYPLGTAGSNPAPYTEGPLREIVERAFSLLCCTPQAFLLGQGNRRPGENHLAAKTGASSAVLKLVNERLKTFIHL